MEIKPVADVESPALIVGKKVGRWPGLTRIS
jgi:hypothetical protein